MNRNSWVALGWIYLTAGGVLILAWRISYLIPILILAVLVLAAGVGSLVAGYRRQARDPSEPD